MKCWDLRIAAEPERREAIVQEVSDRAGGVSLGDQLEIARWLLQHGWPALAEKLAAPSKLKSEEWFMVYLDAVAGLGDWERVLGEVTTGTTVPLPSSVRRLFQLRAEMELHRNPDSGFAWNAIRLALGSASPKQQLYVAGYAEQMGFPANAAPVYRRCRGRAAARRPRQAGSPRYGKPEACATPARERCAVTQASSPAFGVRQLPDRLRPAEAPPDLPRDFPPLPAELGNERAQALPAKRSIPSGCTWHSPNLLRKGNHDHSG